MSRIQFLNRREANLGEQGDCVLRPLLSAPEENSDLVFQNSLTSLDLPRLDLPRFSDSPERNQQSLVLSGEVLLKTAEDRTGGDFHFFREQFDRGFLRILQVTVSV
jgi:hypothetical protein